LYSSDFIVPETLENEIILTSQGEELFNYIKDLDCGFSSAEINLAIFIKFYKDGLLIDLKKSNTEKLKLFFNEQLLKNKIIYPWAYDTILYNRYFKYFKPGKIKLKLEETKKLLKDTYQGVFQIHHILIGPFGLLESFSDRLLFPSRELPLWHCQDHSCSALHPVILQGEENNVVKTYDILNDKFPEIEQDIKFFLFFVSFIIPKKEFYILNYRELPLLLANAFSENELKKIVKYIFEGYSKRVRKMIPDNKNFNDIFSKNSDEISKGLNKAQCFQLILILNDEEIVDIIETLVEKKIIKIPINEKRKTPVFHDEKLPVYGVYDPICELSLIGVRSIPTKEQIFPLARLKSLIKELYAGKGGIEQLEWKLRRIKGLNIYQKLDEYLHTNNPREVLTELILDKKERTQETFSILRYGNFKLPETENEEKKIISKILWKLGFNIDIYPEYQRLFWERLELMLNKAKTNKQYIESDKESIRSAGVNFFVSLEELLDYSLSFTTWVLLSDHYKETKFKFDFDIARKFMVSVLNGKKISSKETLKLDAGGRNTLYPLIKAFNILANLCEEIIKSKPRKYERTKKEMPSYYFQSNLDLFPFVHKVLILDIIKEEQENIIGILKEITKTFDAENICDIRNRIEHKREDFPKQNDIENMYEAILDIVKKMEKNGICPTIYFI